MMRDVQQGVIKVRGRPQKAAPAWVLPFIGADDGAEMEDDEEEVEEEPPEEIEAEAAQGEFSGWDYKYDRYMKAEGGETTTDPPILLHRSSSALLQPSLLARSPFPPSISLLLEREAPPPPLPPPISVGIDLCRWGLRGSSMEEEAENEVEEKAQGGGLGRRSGGS